MVAQEFRDSSLRGRIADSHEAIQKNKCALAQPNLARFVVQKIGIKDAVVPSADFLLESEKRGSPPKSEKRQLLARRGSGAGGAALLRKETSESKKIVGDSRIAKIDCFGQSPRNDDIFLDSSATLSPQNDKSFVDCYELLCDSYNDGLFDSTNRTRNDRFILTRSKF